MEWRWKQMFARYMGIFGKSQYQLETGSRCIWCIKDTGQCTQMHEESGFEQYVGVPSMAD